MAVVPLLKGAGADVMGGGICAPQLSMVLSLLEVTTAVSSSNSVGIGNRIAQIRSRVEHVMLVSGSDILSVNFAIYLGTPHNNAPSLCTIVIMPPPTSHLVTRPQQILSLGFLTPTQINMLLQILLV
jgi:hypothetical protein